MPIVDTDSVIGRIYDSVAGRDRWAGALECACELLAADGMMLLYCNLVTGALQVFTSGGFESGLLAGCAGRHLDDELVRESMELPVGLVVSRTYSMEDEWTRTTAFRRSLANPSGRIHIAGGAAVRNPDVYASLWMVRDRNLPGFSSRDIYVFNRLLPHVGRAVAAHHRLACAKLEASMAAGAIDRIAVGMVLLDIRGKAVLTNREAKRILDLDDGVSMVGRRLVAADTNQTEKLQRTMRRVCGSSSNRDPHETHSGATVRISRRDGRTPYHVVVVPLPRRCQPPDAAGAVAVLFITDPDRGQSPADLLCGDLYDLTAAEVRLVSTLLEHSGLTAAADVLGISRNTAHSQLASIFQKTGTRSQGELLRLVLGSIAPVETPDSDSGFHPAFDDPDISRA